MRFWNESNIVTTLRIMLIFVVAGFLIIGEFYLKIAAFFLVILVIFMDWLDGYFAEVYDVKTKFGAVYDLIGDRIVENVLWITLAYLQLIPIWVPLIVITRSFITDGLRSVALESGKTAFGKSSMMTSRIGIWIASSRISRGLYGGLKTLTFCFAIALFALKDIFPGANFIIADYILFVFVSATIIFCVMRSAVVVYDSKKYFR